MKDIFKIFHFYFRDPKSQLTLISTIMVIIVVVTQTQCENKNIEAPTQEQRHENLSDLIPEGSSLVPLDLSNAESLNQLITSSSWADLYAVEEPNKKKQWLIRNVKLYKTQDYPPAFSTIISEKDENIISSLNQPLFAILKKKKKMSTQSEKNKKNTIQTLPGDNL